MEKRKFEKLNLETSLLGFGCMRFPTLNGEIDYETSERMIDYAMESGVNYYDTAFPYHDGECEPFLGRVLNKYDRSSYYLATKLPVWQVKKVEDARIIFENQLKRLDKDYIDFYLLHSLKITTYIKMKLIGVIDYLESLKEEGRIRYLGFSFHDNYGAFEKIITDREWDFCQIQLNYMDTMEQAGMEGYELSEKLGIPTIVMEPVKGGTLAAFSDEIEEKFKNLNHKASIASYALRFVGSLPNVKLILSGMSNMEQVEDNINTFINFKPLNQKEKDTIEDVIKILRSKVKNSCTGCKYCVPCPTGVAIPQYFKLWNDYYRYQSYSSIEMEWNELKNKAMKCIQCGQCLDKCPQKINIPRDLIEAQRDLINLSCTDK